MKPVPAQQEPALDFCEVRNHLKVVCGKDLDDWSGKYASHGQFKDKDVPYQNFWHWITDRQNPNKNTFFYLSKEDADGEEPWVQEAIALIFKEFGEYAQGDCLRFWVSW